MSAGAYGDGDGGYRTHAALEKNEVFETTEVDDRYIRFDHTVDDVTVVEDTVEQSFEVYEDDEEPTFERDDAEGQYRTVAGFEYAAVSFSDVLREFERDEDFVKVREDHMPPRSTFEYDGEEHLEVQVAQEGVYFATEGEAAPDVGDLREGLVFHDFFANDMAEDDAHFEIEHGATGEVTDGIYQAEAEFWEGYEPRSEALDAE